VYILINIIRCYLRC